MGIKDWAARKAANPKDDVVAYKKATMDADVKAFNDVMAKARHYVVDFDKDGKKAAPIRDLLEKTMRRMEEHGDNDKAISMLKEMRSILSEKMGPAARAALPGQIHAK